MGLAIEQLQEEGSINPPKKSAGADAAERLMRDLPKEVREAIEAMQRTTRVRRVYSADDSPRLRYRKVD